MRFARPRLRPGRYARRTSMRFVTLSTLVAAMLPAAAFADDRAVLVGFHAAPGAAQVQLIEGLGGRVTHQYKYIPVFAAMLPDEQLGTLAAHPGVAYVE